MIPINADVAPSPYSTYLDEMKHVPVGRQVVRIFSAKKTLRTPIAVLSVIEKAERSGTGKVPKAKKPVSGRKKKKAAATATGKKEFDDPGFDARSELGIGPNGSPGTGACGKLLRQLKSPYLAKFPLSPSTNLQSVVASEAAAVALKKQKGGAKIAHATGFAQRQISGMFIPTGDLELDEKTREIENRRRKPPVDQTLRLSGEQLLKMIEHRGSKVSKP
ncbi:uncharacterized protein BJ171DRAFT_518084 [Polychytrium aggregatum]|uniref:uncharacterized protein n=1 Tax=Polychytrium aggregatum TaxID=110093 RepID=UPI0022FE8B97|nr:uncharacterized protein BJ171DRAFT_518084 [Polychytrium aggregatum]KAI9199615.1 hypothetical protein BJ171DRAFT_518084 [Polychytrium aggregatum]